MNKAITQKGFVQQAVVPNVLATARSARSTSSTLRPLARLDVRGSDTGQHTHVERKETYLG